MNTMLQRNPARGLAALRRFSEPRSPGQRCELCAAPAPGPHQHLVDPQERRLVCVCDACAILFDHSGVTRYRRVPRDIRELAGFEIADALWSGLGIPIGLVFFFRSSVSKAILAIYPSPGGSTETGIEEDLWKQLTAQHRSLSGLQDDVEALLVNRIRDACECYSCSD
jgi:Family of unknown function (DUF5947)